MKEAFVVIIMLLICGALSIIQGSTFGIFGVIFALVMYALLALLHTMSAFKSFTRGRRFSTAVHETVRNYIRIRRAQKAAFSCQPGHIYGSTSSQDSCERRRRHRVRLRGPSRSHS